MQVIIACMQKEQAIHVGLIRTQWSCCCLRLLVNNWSYLDEIKRSAATNASTELPKARHTLQSALLATPLGSSLVECSHKVAKACVPCLSATCVELRECASEQPRGAVLMWLFLGCSGCAREPTGRRCCRDGHQSVPTKVKCASCIRV
ncbi:Protein of unknown function [Gryllus bimaculatus]|nr:Protein of unknown function [Gryllus bimaculatus]